MVCTIICSVNLFPFFFSLSSLFPAPSVSPSACSKTESNQSIQVSWADQWCGKKLTFHFTVWAWVCAFVSVCAFVHKSRGKRLELSLCLLWSQRCHQMWHRPRTPTTDQTHMTANTDKQPSTDSRYDKYSVCGHGIKKAPCLFLAFMLSSMPLWFSPSLSGWILSGLSEWVSPG